MNLGQAPISLASERMRGKRYNPKDHKSGFRPTAKGSERRCTAMRLFLNKKEVLVIKRILESLVPKDDQEREVTQALLRRIAKCQAMQGTKHTGAQ